MFQSAWYRMGRGLVTLAAHTVLKMDVIWKYPRPTGPVILAANHPSTSDPAIITTLVPEQTTILIKDVLFKVPLFGKSLQMAGHLPVTHGQGCATLKEAERLLRAGRTVVIFPEGEISPAEGGFNKPHSGLARLALATGATVIPVGIALDPFYVQTLNTQVEGQIEPGKWYLHGPYAMTVGQPLTFAGSSDDRARVKEVTEQVMQQIAALTQESARRVEAQEYAATLPIRLFNIGLRFVIAG